MPCVIRTTAVDQAAVIELANEEWRLQPQVEALEAWLQQHSDELDPKIRWIADIGFCVRTDARGGGPIISQELMRRCIASNVEIYLSEYPDVAN